jgi:uncharacterized protein
MNTRSASRPDIRTIIVKLASRCNLKCTYCYLYEHADHSYQTRPRFMSPTVFDALLERAAEAASQNTSGKIDLVMHGGEPTLLRREHFSDYVARARVRLGARLGRINVQTNGTLIDDAWIDALLAGGVQVGVSLDGPQQLHDASRVDHARRGSWQRAVTAIERMRQRGLDAGTLTVISPGADGRAVFDFLVSLGVRRMNFLLPDVSHDDFQAWYGHLGPTPIAGYLTGVMDAWLDRDDPGILVGVCWDIVERLLGGPGISDIFGNPALKYIAVETDGTIEALDALKVGREGLADTGLNVLRNRLSELGARDTLAARALTTGFPLAGQCARCRYAAECAGGYLPHRYSDARGFDNPSVWCRDLLAVFDHAAQRVLRQPSRT